MTPTAGGGAGRKRLLVVDDEEDMLDFIERVFRREFVVRRASSVDEAVALLAGERFDVVITDQRMPRRSGLELLEQAAALYPHAARVLLTGYTDLAETPGGADAYITKPVDGDTLRQRVTETLARKLSASP